MYEDGLILVIMYIYVVNNKIKIFGFIILDFVIDFYSFIKLFKNLEVCVVLVKIFENFFIMSKVF